jgi:hypothetical protein
VFLAIAVDNLADAESLTAAEEEEEKKKEAMKKSFKAKVKYEKEKQVFKQVYDFKFFLNHKNLNL